MPLQDRLGRVSWRHITFSLLGGVVVLIILLAWLHRTSVVPASSEPASTEHSLPVPVQVSKPARRDLAYTISLPANVSPLYQTTLYAKVSGYLKWIGPDKGDHVKKGQVLAVIDAPEVQEQYHQAVADYQIKKITYERLSNVWKETPDVIAKQDVDVAEAAFKAAKHVMEQRLALQDYLKVRAPYAGVITARFVDPGALIQVATSSTTSAIPLFTIMDIETVRVYANVPQEDASFVKPGMTTAIVTVKDNPPRSYERPVTRTTNSLDPSTRTLLIEIDLPNQDHALQPGTFAEVTLTLRHSPEALVIPPGAIVTHGTAKAVFVADARRARMVSVRTGINDGRWVEVVEGLTGNEDVVVVGKTNLTDGMRIEASPYNLPEGTPGSQRYEKRT